MTLDRDEQVFVRLLYAEPDLTATGMSRRTGLPHEVCAEVLARLYHRGVLARRLSPPDEGYAHRAKRYRVREGVTV